MRSHRLVVAPFLLIPVGLVNVALAVWIHSSDGNGTPSLLIGVAALVLGAVGIVLALRRKRLTGSLSGEQQQ